MLLLSENLEVDGDEGIESNNFLGLNEVIEIFCNDGGVRNFFEFFFIKFCLDLFVCV